MNPEEIRAKFGDDYQADERSFIMGIDQRFTAHFAKRFNNLVVLETCTGAGFTTISLARKARRIITVEIDKERQEQAISNVEKAGLLNRVTFLHGSILDPDLPAGFPPVDAAFIDPDWAVTGPDHIYRFIDSNTQPPADVLLNKVFELTNNAALVLPPYIDVKEFDDLPVHERERLYLGDSHELFCLYFGKLMTIADETEFREPV